MSIETELEELRRDVQHKTLGAWGDGAALLTAAGVDVGAPGVVTAADSSATFAEHAGQAPSWERLAPHAIRL
jgi:hypothetical protein